MSDQDSTMNSRARSDASLTEDLVRLAANEERLSAKFTSYFFGAIFLVGVYLLMDGIYRSNHPLPTDDMNYGLIGIFGGLFAMFVGSVGVWAGRRSAKKLSQVLERH